MHVLCAPPAFLLSQDQTLKFDLVVDFVNFIFVLVFQRTLIRFLVLSNSGYLLYCIVLFLSGYLIETRLVSLISHCLLFNVLALSSSAFEL